MADKKDAPKDAKKPAAPTTPPIEKAFLVFLGLFVLLGMVVLPAVLSAFNIDSGEVLSLNSIKEFLIVFIAKIFTTTTFIAIFLTLLFLILIIYTKFKYNQVIEQYKMSKQTLTVQLGAGGGSFGASHGFPVLPGAQAVGMSVHGPEAEGGVERWRDIEYKINSASPSDWRLAILEADIILFDMLTQMGLPGKDLGEKLRAADTSFFSTLDDAWRAHKVRNVIAHEGAAYELTFNEARRTIESFRRVFEEFYFI
jgi:hypothetical protein